MWHLVINGPGHHDARHPVPPGVTKIGRADDNDLLLPGDAVSRHHARLRCSETGLAWEDLGSRNGTILNGVRTTGTSLLGAGDVLVVGGTTLRVEHLAPGQLSEGGPGAETPHVRGVKRLARDGTDLEFGAAVLAERSVASQPAPSADGEALAPGARSVPGVRSRKSPIPGPRETYPGAGPEPELDHAHERATRFLVRVAEAALETTGLQSFSADVCALALAHLGATSAALLLRDASGALVPEASRADPPRDGEVPVSDSIVAAAARDRRALAVSSPLDATPRGSRSAAAEPRVRQHVVCVPTGDQPPAAVLYLNRDDGAGLPLEACLDAATLGMQLVGAAVHHLKGSPARSRRQRAITLERIYGPLASAAPSVRALASGLELPPLEPVSGTVLWVDLVDFWSCADRLPAAAATTACSLFRRTFTHHVLAQGGVVARAEGDHGLAFFEGQEAKGDGPIRAVRCALALRTGWELELARVHADPTVPLRLKMALDTGSLRAGPFGDAGDLAYALLGQPVLVASRLCASAANDEVLLTERTLAVTGARFDVLPLGQRTLAELSTSAFAFSVTEEDMDANTLPGVR